MLKMERSTLSRAKEVIIEKFFLLNALSSIFIMLLIFFFLFREGIQTFLEIPFLDFFGGSIWQPLATEPKYGILPLMTGTLLVTAGATVIAVPIGVFCAAYLSEIAHPKIRDVFKPLIEILAGIPSVVYGFVALTVLADVIQSTFGNVYRLNALNGAIILAVMMIPTIVSITEDAISAVPSEYREASFALGATHWETIRGVVLPASLSGTIVAITLGIGRAIGETMAVLMATGNAPIVTFDFFSSVEPMTATIAIELGEVTFGSLHYNALFAIGIVLFLVTLGINIFANIFFQKFKGTGR
jgi:phosphate transport system permease protein